MKLLRELNMMIISHQTEDLRYKNYNWFGSFAVQKYSIWNGNLPGETQVDIWVGRKINQWRQ